MKRRSAAWPLFVMGGIWGTLPLLVACSGEPVEEPPPDVHILAQAFEYIPPFDLTTRVEGAEICVVDPPGYGCDTSDGGGEALIGPLPAGTRVLVRMERADFVVSLRDFIVPDADAIVTMPLVSEALAQGFADLVGIPWPDSERGTIAFDTAMFSGLVAEISPAAGNGPFYVDEAGIPDPAREATSTTGIGFFTSLAPGEYTVSVQGCGFPDAGVPGPTRGTARITVTSGTISFLTLDCP